MGRQQPSGFFADPVPAARQPLVTLFALAGGGDVWNAVNALLALRATGRWSADAERFLRGHELEGGGFPHWSSRQMLCVETTAAATTILPDLRPRIVAVLRRHALPGGRWATGILDEPGGFEHYVCAPSATAWTLTALGAADPLTGAGRRYLEETLGERGMWRAHSAFYGTPFYPAHLATPWIKDPARVHRYVLDTALPTGGWAYGDPPGTEASTLPTAWSVQTLLSCDSAAAPARGAAQRGVQWLLAAQRGDGSFPMEPRPPEIWYGGDVFATAAAVMALVRWSSDAGRE